MRSIAGVANPVPCGVRAKVSPSTRLPGGSGGAPLDDVEMESLVAVASAPAGTTTCEPAGPATVPPAASILTPSSSEPPQAASPAAISSAPAARSTRVRKAVWLMARSPR
jgi:hypothetical protein